MPEAEPRDRELHRHRRHVRRERRGLDELPAVREHVVQHVRLHDPRQEVVADQPLVVQGHRPPGPPEPPACRDRRGQLVHDPVVEADHREVGLRHDQVLVVAGVRDQRPALRPRRAGADPGQVVSDLLAVRADPDRGAGLEVQAVVLVELRGLLVGRARAVQRVEVEARRARLEQLRRCDLLTQADLGDVHGQVVVDELAEVGVARRHVSPAATPLGHRLGQLLDQAGPDRPALRPDAREPERRRLVRGQARRRRGLGIGDRIGLVAPAATHLGVHQALALDEEALGTVSSRHRATVGAGGPR